MQTADTFPSCFASSNNSIFGFIIFVVIRGLMLEFTQLDPIDPPNINKDLTVILRYQIVLQFFAWLYLFHRRLIYFLLASLHP